MQRAFENRPEVQAGREGDRASRRCSSRSRATSACPRSTASSRYGQTGLVGSRQPDFDACRFVDPDHARPRCRSRLRSPPISRRATTATASTTTTTRPSYTARARFSIPIPNTTRAHERVDRTEFELSRAETRLRRLEQTIILEVRQAARNLSASQEGIVAAAGRAARRRRAAARRAHPARVRRVDALRRAPARGAARRPRERADQRVPRVSPLGHGRSTARRARSCATATLRSPTWRRCGKLAPPLEGRR